MMKKTIYKFAIAIIACRLMSTENCFAQPCFNSAIYFAVDSIPDSVISADFNGDGKLDLATTNNNSGNVSVLLGIGTGNFGAATYFAINSNQPLSLCSSDFNGDGKLDLATVNYNSPYNISVLLGTGTGSFGPAVNFSTGGILLKSIISADFNGDGKADLAGAGDGYHVSVFLGTGTGSFGTVTHFTVGVGNAPTTIISADFNGDCKPDLATANSSSNDASVLLGTGTGSFSVAVNFTVSVFPYSVTSADFNGDGKADLATANSYSDNISVLLNCDVIGCVDLIKERNNEKNVFAYPNPATNVISLNSESISNYQNSTIIIQNTLGQTVKKISFTKNVDISDLAEGCYFLQILLPSGETYKTKFIKQ